MLQARRNAKIQSWLALLLVLSVASCGRGGTDSLDVGVDLVVSPEPPRIGPSMVTVTLSEAGGKPIESAQVELEANMSHAGMVPVLATAPEVAPGRYEAPLEFTMGGDWFILVRAELPDGRSLERQVDVPGVDMPRGETAAP